MPVFKAYSSILQGHEAIESEALKMAVHIASGEIEDEATEQEIGYPRYIETVDGVDVYYDYGADYYFFVDPS